MLKFLDFKNEKESEITWYKGTSVKAIEKLKGKILLSSHDKVLIMWEWKERQKLREIIFKNELSLLGLCILTSNHVAVGTDKGEL